MEDRKENNSKGLQIKTNDAFRFPQKDPGVVTKGTVHFFAKPGAYVVLLKIERYGTGLTQGYNTDGSSG